MNFKDIYGHEREKHRLRSMFDNGRMPHSLLLLGNEGSGNLALALAFARYILCIDKKEGEPCGECTHCVQSGKWFHPDMHFVFPCVGSNVTSNDFLVTWREKIHENPYMNANQWLQAIGAENKQGNINKLECVQIIKKLSLKTFTSDYKILVLWLPEYLAKEGNRLLKLIEEPPEKTIFLLVAQNQEKILNTILSRCQLVQINSFTDEDIALAMEERYEKSKDKANSIAHLADGNFNAALTLLDTTEVEQANLFLEWFRICFRGNGIAMVNWVTQFAKYGRENQKHFLQYALYFMREYMVLKMTGSEEHIRLQPKELATAVKLKSIIEFEQIENITGLFNECSYYIERNANPKILFLDASIQLNHILKTQVSTAN